MLNMQASFPSGKEIIPVVLQDQETEKVIAIRYINEAAFTKTKETENLYTYNEKEDKVEELNLPHHGRFRVHNIHVSKNPPSILVKGLFLHHMETSTEYGERNNDKAAFLNTLKDIIRDRKGLPGDDEASNASYTKSLFDKGINKIAQKVGEEAVELVIESKDANKDLFKGEAADLIFHYLILLEAKEIDLDEIIEVLISRHRKK